MKKLLPILTTLLLTCLPSPAHGQPPTEEMGNAEDSRLLEVFPESTTDAVSGQKGSTVFSDVFTESGSIWEPRIVESRVFQFQLDHRQSPENSFQLRIGKGGQIYSLRGPFGESVPPSWRDERSDVSPWNDEVWQFVSVCTRYNGIKTIGLSEGKLQTLKQSPYRDTFFVHNSGAYIPRAAGIDSLYCPLLRFDLRSQDRCIRMLNWGLVPQVKTVHRSPILYYTQIRDAGDGIIELTWVVHNFGNRDDLVFDFHNAPWGGTRVTSLPLQWISSPSGELLPHAALFNKKYNGAIDIRRSGGWKLSSVSEADDSPSLALVYGRDQHLEEELQKAKDGLPHVQFAPSLLRAYRAGKPHYDPERGGWKDWQTRPENSFRNYDVVEMIPKLRLSPGTSIWYRSFLVVDRKDRAIEKARSLVPHVDYGQATFDASDTPTVELKIDATVGKATDSQDLRATLFARPVPGSMPLFRIRNTQTGRIVISTDPYIFVPQEKLDLGLPDDHPQADYFSEAIGYSLDENNCEWQSLLGFGLKEKPSQGSWRRLSELVGEPTFPRPSRYHLDLWVAVDAE